MNIKFVVSKYPLNTNHAKKKCRILIFGLANYVKSSLAHYFTKNDDMHSDNCVDATACATVLSDCTTKCFGNG